jgi:hypothetical protein
MRLITAHKILIGSAVIFFLYFSLWELRQYFGSGESGAIFRAILYLAVAVGFGIYFKSLKRLFK